MSMVAEEAKVLANTIINLTGLVRDSTPSSRSASVTSFKVSMNSTLKPAHRFISFSTESDLLSIQKQDSVTDVRRKPHVDTGIRFKSNLKSPSRFARASINLKPQVKQVSVTLDNNRRNSFLINKRHSDSSTHATPKAASIP